MTLADPPEMKLFASEHIQVDDIRMHYATIGEGKPIVLVHGWTGSWIGWIPVALSLRHKYKVYIPDLPGFGDSGTIDKQYSVEELATYLEKFIKALKIKPKVIAGNSLGSFVTSQVAKNNPTITDKIVLIGPVFRASKRQYIAGTAMTSTMKLLNSISHTRRLTKILFDYPHIAYAMAYLFGFYNFNKETVDLYNMKGRRKMTDKSFIETYISGNESSLEKLLDNPRPKVLIMQGKYDRISKLEHAKRKLKKHNGKIQYYSIEDAGHTISVEKPYEVAQKIIEFISQKSA